MIYIASDHGGFATKEGLKKYFNRIKLDFIDLGTNSKDSVDYPDYAKKVVNKVKKSKLNKGILICGTGTGMAIEANRHKGIRAAMCYDKYSAKMSRHDNNSNILTLRGRFISLKKNKEIAKTWLNTPFSKLPRHKRRVKKLG